MNRMMESGCLLVTDLETVITEGKQALPLYIPATPAGWALCLPAVISNLQKLRQEAAGGRCCGASEAPTSSALPGICFGRR